MPLKAASGNGQDSSVVTLLPVTTIHHNNYQSDPISPEIGTSNDASDGFEQRRVDLVRLAYGARVRILLIPRPGTRLAEKVLHCSQFNHVLK